MVRDIKVKSRGPASFPVVLKLDVELAAPQGDDCVALRLCRPLVALHHRFHRQRVRKRKIDALEYVGSH